jgi:hypothetical protein
MTPKPPDSRQLGRYFALAQVGLEMAAPIGLGWLIDGWLGWFPWATVSGAVLGLVGGMYHLIVMLNQPDPPEQGPQP